MTNSELPTAKAAAKSARSAGDSRPDYATIGRRASRTDSSATPPASTLETIPAAGSSE